MKSAPVNLGLFCRRNKIVLYSSINNNRTFTAHTSSDGTNFYQFDDTCVIIAKHGSLVSPILTKNYRVTFLEGGFFLTFASQSNKNNFILYGATSQDGLHWYTLTHNLTLGENGQLLPGYLQNDRVGLIKGGNSLSLYTSSDFKQWLFNRTLLPQKHGGNYYAVQDVLAHTSMFAVIYAEYKPKVNNYYSLYALLLDAKDGAPVWKNPKLLWKGSSSIENEKDACIGTVYFQTKLFSYWKSKDKSLRVFSHNNLLEMLNTASSKQKKPLLYKSYKNPILKPQKKHIWESQAVFNAAAVYDRNKVHLLYRAVGDAGISMLGYAASSDGFHIDSRSKHPVYIPKKPFEGGYSKYSNSASPYISGPGWGGCEDPRITKIDGRFYLMYVAFDGCSPPRLALTSITEKNFHQGKWQWSSPVLVSKPDTVDKSGAILPEKIKGKYVIFHRVYPNIYIDYVESLDFDGSVFLKNTHVIKPRKSYWDSRKVGIGAVPIKTQDGWLAIYNAVDDKDDSRYKIGAMLLDLDNPSKVIARSVSPILEPTEYYENNGLKYGVVYPCGAVVLNHQLIVYYGGSDTYVCAASSYLPTFLKELKQHKKITLDSQNEAVISFTSSNYNTNYLDYY